MDEHGRRVTLFEEIYNVDGRTWGWTLLAFDGGSASNHDQLLTAGSTGLPDWVRPRLVVGDPAAAAGPSSPVARLFDLDRHAHTAYGLQGTPALVLVRPDGHIAFRGPAEATDDLERYLEHLTDDVTAAA